MRQYAAQIFQSTDEAMSRAAVAWGVLFVFSAAVAVLTNPLFAPITALIVVPTFAVTEYHYGRSGQRSVRSRLGDFLEVLFYTTVMVVALPVFVLAGVATFSVGLQSPTALIGFPVIAWAALFLLAVLGGIIRQKAKAHAYVTSHGR